MQARVEELTARATSALAEAPIDDGARPVLAGLAAVLVDRSA